MGRWRSPVIPCMIKWILTTVLFVLGMPGGRGEYVILRLVLDRRGALLSGRRRGVFRLAGLGDLVLTGVLTSTRFLGGVCTSFGLADLRLLVAPCSDRSPGVGLLGRSGLLRMSSKSARWLDL